MFGAADDDEVLDPVIERIAIHMVHHLVDGQPPPEVLLKDMAVLRDCDAVN